MATVLIPGYRNPRLTRNPEGHRTYKVVFLVASNDKKDGPVTILSTAGLPAIGSTWAYGNDVDPYAYATPEVNVKPTLTNEQSCQWEVEYTFTTRPIERCQTGSIEDPLLEPDKISGSFVNYVREATMDRFGNRLKTSSHEQLRGSQVEFDHHKAQVTITQNVASLGLATLTSMMNTVNATPLWGLPPRRIKLSGVNWSQLFQGICGIYYSRTLSFDIDFRGFDRVVLDEGTKVLNGRWADEEDGSGSLVGVEWVDLPVNGAPPNPDNPTHFIHYKDRNDQNTTVILDGTGRPAELSSTGTGMSEPGQINIEFYPESDFTLLGIPLTL